MPIGVPPTTCPIYLYDNPLLKRPLILADIEHMLTGRHGLFNCYEAFIHIVDSMFNQQAKWLKVTSRLPRRRKIASLNCMRLTATTGVFRYFQLSTP